MTVIDATETAKTVRIFDVGIPHRRSGFYECHRFDDLHGAIP